MERMIDPYFIIKPQDDIDEQEADLLTFVATYSMQRPAELVWIYRKLKEIGPQTALEIGTGAGGMSLALASLGCSVVTIDRHTNERYNWEEYPKFAKRIKQISGDSTDAKTVDKVCGVYDVVLIDGGHDWETGNSDYLNYGPMATKLIGLHDIGDYSSKWDVAWNWWPTIFWYKIKQQGTLKTDEFTDVESGAWGVIHLA